MTFIHHVSSFTCGRELRGKDCRPPTAMSALNTSNYSCRQSFPDICALCSAGGAPYWDAPSLTHSRMHTHFPSVSPRRHERPHTTMCSETFRDRQLLFFYLDSWMLMSPNEFQGRVVCRSRHMLFVHVRLLISGTLDVIIPLGNYSSSSSRTLKETFCLLINIQSDSRDRFNNT